MNTSKRRMYVLYLALVAVLSSGTATANPAPVYVTLEVSPATPTAGNWGPGSLVEMTILGSTDGGPNQGFSGADFRTDALGIRVLDPTRLHIHDVKAFGSFQVDTESDAETYEGTAGSGYVKSEDSWAYDEYSVFQGSVDMTDTTFEAVAMCDLQQYGDGLGTGGVPVEFLHIVLEIQGDWPMGASSAVEFYGQVGAYNQPEEETGSIIFGSQLDPPGSVNMGQFTLTRVPEPSTVLLLLSGVAVFSGKTRRRTA
jgi:hypothetical protein